MAAERNNIENDIGGTGPHSHSNPHKEFIHSFIPHKEFVLKSRKEALKDIKINKHLMKAAHEEISLFTPLKSIKETDISKEELRSKKLTSEKKLITLKKGEKEEEKNEEEDALAFFTPEPDDTYADIFPPSLVLSNEQIVNFALGYSSLSNDDFVTHEDITPPEIMTIEKKLSQIDLWSDSSDVLDPSQFDIEFSELDHD